MTDAAPEEPDQMPDPDWVTRQFTRSDGSFRFARWARPLAPVIVGTDDQGCKIFEDGIRHVATVAGAEAGELDPDLGANFMVFLVNEWHELEQAPNLVRLLPNLADLIENLTTHGANQYRVFNFDPEGALRLCISLIRYDDQMQSISAQTLAVNIAFQGMLLWSDQAFRDESPFGVTNDGVCLIKPAYARLLQAAYDPVLPSVGNDPAFALRLAARMAG
ncbi:MAG: hypothetical protein AAGK00_04400 [Pseudomonadota bacterium]